LSVVNIHLMRAREVLGDIVELQAAEQASGFARREGLIKCTSRVGRQIVQHDADALCPGK